MNTQKYNLDQLEMLAYLFTEDDYQNEISKEPEDRDFSIISYPIRDAVLLKDDVTFYVHWECDDRSENDLETITVKELKQMIAK